MPGGLKHSQVYPPEYGREVARLWEIHRPAVAGPPQPNGPIDEDSDADVPFDQLAQQKPMVDAALFPELGLDSIAAFANVPAHTLL